MGGLSTVFGDGRHGGVAGVAAVQPVSHCPAAAACWKSPEHRVNDYRRHDQHRAQHGISASGLLLRFFHLFGYLPFAICVLRILHRRGLDRLPYEDDRLKLRVFSSVSLGTAGVPWFLNFFESISTCSELIGLGLLLRAFSVSFCSGFLTLSRSSAQAHRPSRPAPAPRSFSVEAPLPPRRHRLFSMMPTIIRSMSLRSSSFFLKIASALGTSLR